MATRFARVTVVADERALDVSLPADRPIVELLPQIHDLMSLPARTVGPWTLSSVSGGTLDPRRSLSEAGILDADRLYLTAPTEAPVPPVVDDVVDEVQAILDGDGSEWGDEPRLVGTVALAAIVVLALTVSVPAMPLHPAGALALLVDIGVCALVAGGLLGARGGRYLLLAGVPAWTLAGIEVVRLAGPPPAAPVTALVAAGLAGAAIGAAGLWFAGGWWHAAGTGGVTVLPFAGLAVILLAAGLRPGPAAAVLAVLVTFAAGIAPQIALARSRLVRMLRAEQDGQLAGRDEVAAAVRRGQLVLTGAVAGIAVVAALTSAVLVDSPGWWAVALGGTLALVFALRSRAFTRTGQVWPMFLPVTVAGAVAALAVPGRFGLSAAGRTWFAFAGPVLLLLVLAIAARPRLGEVGAARLRQLFDLAELLAVITLVPQAIAVVGGFGWLR